jgi:hypothetical protein
VRLQSLIYIRWSGHAAETSPSSAWRADVCVRVAEGDVSCWSFNRLLNRSGCELQDLLRGNSFQRSVIASTGQKRAKNFQRIAKSLKNGAPEEIRTPDPPIRSLVLRVCDKGRKTPAASKRKSNHLAQKRLDFGRDWSLAVGALGRLMPASGSCPAG